MPRKKKGQGPAKSELYKKTRDLLIDSVGTAAIVWLAFNVFYIVLTVALPDKMDVCRGYVKNYDYVLPLGRQGCSPGKWLGKTVKYPKWDK